MSLYELLQPGEVESMRCVIIGGGGFIGSHLSESLLAAGASVTIFDRPGARNLDSLQQKGAVISVGNFLDPQDVERALSDQDILFHLLSTTVPQTSSEDPRYDVETNIGGTLQLLEVARKAKIKKIIFASSGGTVYGIPREIPILEEHPTEPISTHGIVKLAIEKYLHLYWTLYGLEYCILRISNAYGERQAVTATQGVVAAFLDKALRQAEITIWGDGSAVRDFVYVGNIANAFIKALRYSGEPRIFNIGSGQGHSITDIIGIIEQVIDRPLLVKYIPGRPFDVPINVLDISRARIHLDWQPVVGLFEGVVRTYAWMLNQYEK